MSQESCDTNGYSESSSSSLLRDISLESTSSNSSTFLSRTGTVRRALTVFKNEANLEEKPSPEKHHKSFDATAYRLSLDSISEYKAKRSFSTQHRHPSSMDSSSSEFTDNRGSISDSRGIISPESHYLNWIGSVHGDYFNYPTIVPEKDVDHKIGEWNSFWLNYNSSRGRYLNSHDDKMPDDFSDVKSTCSTQRECVSGTIALSVEEINEAIKCSQKITEILQAALKRGNKCDYCEHDSRFETSFCAHQVFVQQNSTSQEDATPLKKERSYSYANPQDLEKQRKLLKPVFQTTNNCIQSLFNSTVGDILKKAISKRRDVFGPNKDSESTTSQDSFS